jgi:ubiquinone/menaquinone biosynthesis C-methylase UbiE
MGKVTAVETSAAYGEVQRYQISSDISVPKYLIDTYWWAYVNPKAVRFFERQWLVNLILWGNFSRLRDAALDALGTTIPGRTLQVACVYGNFSQRLAERIEPGGSLDVVDVVPVQLKNLKCKLGDAANVHLHHQDSSSLLFEDGVYDNVVLFFLLHEQPEKTRVKTIQEALRVTKPGGRIVIVDYHRPWVTNPFRYIMMPILTLLEPYALDLWRREIVEWIPSALRPREVHKETSFGGLYQQIVMIR